MTGFLPARSAASEGAFFYQTSKQAIARFKKLQNHEISPSQVSSPPSPSPSPSPSPAHADVLPEILRHSLPLSSSGHGSDDFLPPSSSPTPSSLASISASSSTSSYSSLSHSQQFNLSNPIVGFLPSLPQASLGRRRWQLSGDDVSFLPSTANEMSMEGRPTINDANAKALMEGYSAVLKAFLVATALLMGGTTVAAGIVAAKLEIHSIDDIRIKGQEHMRSQVEGIQQSVEPWKRWAQSKNEQWNMDDNKRNVISAPFVENLGLKQLLKDESQE